MSIDSKIVTNWDISMHGISDISEVKLCVLTLKNIHILLSGRGKNGYVYSKLLTLIIPGN